MNDSSSLFRDRGVVILIDPDRVSATEATDATRLAVASGFSAAWIGGTFLHRPNAPEIVHAIVKEGQASGLPVSAILGLSSAESVLNPGLAGVLLPLVGTLSAAGELIRQAYRSTPTLAALGVPVTPIGYLAVDGGRLSSTIHGLQGVPLPRDKPEIAATLALCCQFTGAEAVYLDAGSGASDPVPPKLIEAVRATISLPLIIGGGIRRPEQADEAFAVGADMVVVGSVLEGNDSRTLFGDFGAVALARR
jgi:geranylgeranylglyceryl phosphate synthase family protein